jgi:hypothetical protein
MCDSHALRLTMIALLMGLTAQSARGQSVAAQSDFATARINALEGTSTTQASLPIFGSMVSLGNYPSRDAQPLGPPPFSLNLFSPINDYYRSGAGAAAGSALEETPEGKFGFLVHPFGTSFQFSGFIDADSDRYSGAPADGDRVDGSFRIDYVGPDPFPNRDQFIPYLSYSPQQTFEPFFDTGKILTQDYAAGINKLWDFLPSGRRCDGRYSCNPLIEIGLQVGSQHRVVNSGAGSNALIIGPSIKWAPTSMADWPHIDPDADGQVSASVAANITGRWYDELDGVSEQTWSAEPIITASWIFPAKWFGSASAFVGSPELDFQAAYTNQHSTVAKDNFHEWQEGPILRGAWTF